MVIYVVVQFGLPFRYFNSYKEAEDWGVENCDESHENDDGKPIKEFCIVRWGQHEEFYDAKSSTLEVECEQ